MANRILILLFTILSFCCRAQTVSFQQEMPFLAHLDSLKAMDEKMAYLEFLFTDSLNGENDSLSLEMARTCFAVNKFEKALLYFLSVHIAIEDNTDQRKFGLSLLKNKSYRKYPEFNKSWNISGDSVLVIQAMSAAVLADPDNEAARLNLRTRMPIQVPENDLQKKSPLLAGIYSAVIPGSGKYYCGKKNQFLTAFLPTLALGIQTYEAGTKGGMGSARFIVSGILFSFFYFGNIWGSVLEAKNHHIQNYREFENEILDYNSTLVYQQ